MAIFDILNPRRSNHAEKAKVLARLQLDQIEKVAAASVHADDRETFIKRMVIRFRGKGPVSDSALLAVAQECKAGLRAAP